MDEAIVHAARDMYALLEGHYGYPLEGHDKYQCYCIMHCRDVFLVTDPKDFTTSQFIEIFNMGIDALLCDNVTRELARKQLSRILSMGFTTLPTTVYSQKKFKEKHHNMEIK